MTEHTGGLSAPEDAQVIDLKAGKEAPTRLTDEWLHKMRRDEGAMGTPVGVLRAHLVLALEEIDALRAEHAHDAGEKR